jgi:hypothetical protein
MNMGLILFLSSLLLGTPSDKEAENSSEKNTNVDKINCEIIINQPLTLVTNVDQHLSKASLRVIL